LYFLEFFENAYFLSETYPIYPSRSGIKVWTTLDKRWMIDLSLCFFLIIGSALKKQATMGKRSTL